MDTLPIFCPVLFAALWTDFDLPPFVVTFNLWHGFGGFGSGGLDLHEFNDPGQLLVDINHLVSYFEDKERHANRKDSDDYNYVRFYCHLFSLNNPYRHIIDPILSNPIGITP